MKKRWGCLAFALVVGTFSFQGATASADHYPPRGNLFLAKQSFMRLQFHINSLVIRISGGGHGGGHDDGGGGGERCRYIDNPHHCEENQWCHWDRESRRCRASNVLELNSEAIDTSVLSGDPQDDAGVNENDFAANLALQGMGSGLTRLGQKIDEAAALWGTPGFAVPWQQACQGASALLWANQGAKLAANLPPPGFVTAADFIPIDQELYSVRSLLFCP